MSAHACTCVHIWAYVSVFIPTSATHTYRCVPISHLDKMGTKLYVLIIEMWSQSNFTFLFCCFSHETVALHVIFDYLGAMV